MPFSSKCATEALHKQWACPPRGHLKSKVPVGVKNKLLELVGKTENIHYTKGPPKFCEACIHKVLSMYPDLQEEPKDDEFSVFRTPSNQPCVHTVQTDLDDVAQTSSDEPPAKLRRIDLTALKPDEKIQLAYDLGSLESKTLKSYALGQSRGRDVDTLLSIDVKKGHENSSKILEAFLAGLSQIPLSITEDTCTIIHSELKRACNSYKIYKTVESVLNLSAVNLTLPAHFRESVLLYTLTGSKLALKILGSGGAHASYQSVKSWLSSLASVSPEIPTGDLITAFDNNQVLQRRWKVKLKNEVKCNIVTIVVFFNVSKNGRLQQEVKLKHNEWASQTLEEEAIKRIKYIDQAEDLRQIHYSHLHSFLCGEISKVASEQASVYGKLKDDIDVSVENQKKAALYKTCYQCHYEAIPKTKHTCPMCKVNVTKAKMKSMGLDVNGMVEETKTYTHQGKEYRVLVEKCSASRQSHSLTYEIQEQEHDEYKDFEFQGQSSEMAEIPSVLVQHPVYVNPCSYEAVATVMRNIGHRCGVRKYGGDREWVIMVCDGIPYNLCRRIIKTMHTCSKCDVSLNGLDACTEHHNEIHSGEDVDFILEFDWVLLKPGCGHIEMNMVKGIVELGWDIFWKRLAICLNFRSEVALKSAKKVNDHHKGWTMCRIARHAITRELLIPFVRQELSKEQPDLSVATFMKFIMKAQDPNYTFMCDYTFEILDAIFMFRAGVRIGSSKFMEAGRAKYAKLWSGRRHPLYRELEMADTLNNSRMPLEIKHLVLNADSLNLSGKRSTGEGTDFRLEEVNKLIQQWLPNVPSTKDWQIACSNFDKLSEFRKAVFEQMDIVDPKLNRKKYVQNVDEEIAAFRTELRAAEYLLDPNVTRTHVSLDGVALATDLKNFCQLAREKRAKYTDVFLAYEVTANISKAAPPAFKERPVFVTHEEEQQFMCVENKTIQQIKELVQERLDMITDSDIRDALQSLWVELIRDSKKTTKRVLTDFYYELEEYIDNGSSFQDSGDADTDEED